MSAGLKAPFAQRVAALRKELAGKDLPAYLTFQPQNRRYLTGFTGTAGYVLVTEHDVVLLTDSRYREQAERQCPGVTVVQHGPEVWTDLGRCLEERGIGRIGFESEHVSVAQHKRMQAAAPQLDWQATAAVVERLRMIKDAGELAALERSQAVLERAFAATLPFIRPGVRERDVAVRFHIAALEQGADGLAFDTIVASGWRAALPHGVAGDKVIEDGDWLTLDLGVMVDGYASDMTRTFVVGRASERQRKVYEIVLEAQQAALAAIRAGRTGREIDAVARDVIRAAGYGEHFGHGLGHGIGLNIHEGPRLAPSSEHVLEPGMVVTVEPGIYLPGEGGVRIEDVVVVEADGCRNLTSVDKAFTVLCPSDQT